MDRIMDSRRVHLRLVLEKSQFLTYIKEPFPVITSESPTKDLGRKNKSTGRL